MLSRSGMLDLLLQTGVYLVTEDAVAPEARLERREVRSAGGRASGTAARQARFAACAPARGTEDEGDMRGARGGLHC